MSVEAVANTEAARIAVAMPDYDVERELGRGGMGVVYLGRHRRLDRGVAIKELPPSIRDTQPVAFVQANKAEITAKMDALKRGDASAE